VFLSLLPPIIEVLKHKFGKKADAEPLSEPPAA